MNRPTKDPHLVRREDAVLIVVDVQDKLIRTIHEHEEMTERIVRLVKFCEIVGVPVLHAEQIKLGDTIAPIREVLGDAEPLQKNSFGCFGFAPFAERVAATGRKTILLTGIEAHVCVMQTAMGALERGLRVQLIADAVSSSTAFKKEVGIKRMMAAGVELSCYEMALFELMGQANTDEFRQVLPLIK